MNPNHAAECVPHKSPPDNFVALVLHSSISCGIYILYREVKGKLYCHCFPCTFVMDGCSLE